MEKRARVLIDCEDAKGLVYKISKVFYDRGLNIDNNREFVDKEHGRFFMRTVVSGLFDIQELLEEDLMSYTHILGGMKGVGIKDLVKAIKYCNLKRNYSNKEAWSIVEPDKYNALVEGNKQIDNHVSMYNGSKLVVAIDKEMLIPVHLQYAPYFHAAVKKQYELMNGKATKDHRGNELPVSAMVQHLAAKELAVLTKQPEEQKLAISINPGEAAISMQSEMNDQLKAIVAHQKKQLDNGMDIIDVQAIGLDFSDVGKADE